MFGIHKNYVLNLRFHSPKKYLNFGDEETEKKIRKHLYGITIYGRGSVRYRIDLFMDARTNIHRTYFSHSLIGKNKKLSTVPYGTIISQLFIWNKFHFLNTSIH